MFNFVKPKCTACLGNFIAIGMTLTRILLFPFTLLYGIATGLRNYLFDIGYSRSFQYDIMVINVGNLRVGGTGKTPMIEYLIRLLHKQYAVATLSRGYKRKTKGFILADDSSNSAQLGDEPYQMHLKYGKVARVAVGEERSLAIPYILMEHPETQVVLMDDAFQHREVKPDLNILLTDFSQPFYDDSLLPGGRLRETKSGAKRADIIVVTKSPLDIDEPTQQVVIHKIRKYSKVNTPIFFTFLQYGNIRGIDGKEALPDKKYVLFSGLANAEPFEDYLKSHVEVVKTVDFKDHHDYTLEDFQQLVQDAQAAGADLLTTEKDLVKLRAPQFVDLLKKTSLCYVPIAHKFVKDGSIFDAEIFAQIEDKYSLEDQP